MHSGTSRISLICIRQEVFHLPSVAKSSRINMCESSCVAVNPNGQYQQWRLFMTLSYMLCKRVLKLDALKSYTRSITHVYRLEGIISSKPHITRQLEHLRSEIPFASPWLPTLVIHIRPQVKRKQESKLQILKIQILQFCNMLYTWHTF